MLFAYSFLGGSALFLICHDIRTQTIPLLGLLGFIVAALLKQWYEPDIQGLWSATFITLIMLGSQGIFYFFKRRPLMGSGDLILSPFCGVWLCLQELPLFFFSVGSIALFMGILWRYQWKMRTYPLGVALLLGLGGTLLMRCFLELDKL